MHFFSYTPTFIVYNYRDTFYLLIFFIYFYDPFNILIQDLPFSRRATPEEHNPITN